MSAAAKSQAQIDREVANAAKCPVCHELNGHRLMVVNGELTDCPNIGPRHA